MEIQNPVFLLLTSVGVSCEPIKVFLTVDDAFTTICEGVLTAGDPKKCCGWGVCGCEVGCEAKRRKGDDLELEADRGRGVGCDKCLGVGCGEGRRVGCDAKRLDDDGQEVG